MRPTRRRFLASSLAALGAGACGARLHAFPFDGDLSALAWGPDDLGVHFHSVACFTVRWRDVAVLTDPFFTHVGFGRAAFGRVLPDPDAAAPALPDLPAVRAVLIGHAHYDHCLDLPTLAPHLHPDAALLGSATAAHTFASLALPRPWVVVDDDAATATTPGRWWHDPSGRLRVLPIRSGHPDNVPGIHLFRRSLDAPRTTPPTRASHFQEGPTLAWLIDLLETDGTIAHRVYVQTSSTGPPLGLAPPEVFAARPVDVALLAMDCANFHVRDEPSILDHIEARHVLFHHWGNFFRPKDALPREGVKVDLPRVRAELRARPDGERFLFPAWDSRFAFSRQS